MIKEEQEDCFYFLNSTCKKGPNCPFRHSVTARATNTICPTWTETRNCSVSCPMRHVQLKKKEENGIPRKKEDFSSQKRKEEFCYFEMTSGGCTRGNCEYRHRGDFYKELERENKEIEGVIRLVEEEIEEITKRLY